MQFRTLISAAVCCALLAPAALARTAHHTRAAGMRNGSVPTIGAVIYSDPSASSSADVEQVLPNSHTETTAMSSVRQISVMQGVFYFYWGHGALTVLPQRFVINVTVNKHRVAPPHRALPGK